METLFICVVGVIFLILTFLVARYIHKKGLKALIISIASRRFTILFTCLFSENQCVENQQ